MILCLGFSHQTAPLELRERLSLSSADVSDLLRRFSAHAESALPGICELAVLSTCNRVELYADLPTPDAALALLDHLCEARGLARADVEPGLYRYADSEAVAHLCRVAAGLESQVLGETQILGQVTEAYELALAAGAVGQILSAVFQAAIRTGKRTHTETGIGRNPSTVSSAAIHLAEPLVGPLEACSVLVVGAGEMGTLTVRALKSRGVTRIRVTNRTPRAALDLASRYGGEAVPFDDLATALAESDLAVVCTNAPRPVLDAEAVRCVLLARAARTTRPDHALVLVDIAVPRNVAPEVADLPGVTVLNLDHLNALVQDGLRERAVAVPQVEAIVRHEVTAFDDWLNELETLRLIADLHKKADAIRQRELQRTLRYLPDLDPRAQEHIQHLAQSLMDKLLHEPTQRLRSQTGVAKRAVYAEAVRDLFGLEDGAGPHDTLGACS